MLKNIQLELKKEGVRQIALSFSFQEDYEQLKLTCKRREEFIYKDFAEGEERHLIISADDDQCWCQWFPIKLTNKKDDLLPQDIIESRVRKFKL